MHRFTLLVIALCLSTLSLAQTTFKAQILENESGNPLVGATLYFPQLELGGSSDEKGWVSVAAIPNGTHTLLVQYLGYETLRLRLIFPQEGAEPPVYRLEPEEEELEILLVQSNRSSRVIEDVPTRVEIIAGEELSEKGNMKPGDIRMLLNESTGIQTQQTSATSYNSSIRIQGLDGKYTQLLRDGLPLYAGFSSGLSLMQIAPLDLAQVEVVALWHPWLVQRLLCLLLLHQWHHLWRLLVQELWQQWTRPLFTIFLRCSMPKD